MSEYKVTELNGAYVVSKDRQIIPPEQLETILNRYAKVPIVEYGEIFDTSQPQAVTEALKERIAQIVDEEYGELGRLGYEVAESICEALQDHTTGKESEA